MSCERMRERIPECLAGRLDAAERERLMAHVETCPACRAEVAELGAAWRGLQLPAPEPDAAMKARFLEVLEAYQMGMRSAARPARGPSSWPHWSWWPSRAAWQAAFAGLLLVAGALGGRYWSAARGNTANPEIAQLKGQVESLRQLVALSLLQEDSASSRIRGVAYSGQIARPDEQVEQALLRAVNHDPNINVRLSAVDALEKYARNPEVRRAVADAVPVQDSPLVQVALVDLLVAWNDTNAAPALRKLAADPQANVAVRQHATRALQRMGVTE
jgi:hypothetical protein